MGFLQKVAAKVATKYGTVSEGEYKGCEVALGNPPEKKIERANSFCQIIFVDGTEEKGRLFLSRDGNIRCINVCEISETGIELCIEYHDFKTSKFTIPVKKEDSTGAMAAKMLLGMKPVIGGDSEYAIAMKYRKVFVFFLNTMDLFDSLSLRQLYALFDEKKILKDDKSRHDFAKLIEAVEKYEKEVYGMTAEEELEFRIKYYEDLIKELDGLYDCIPEEPKK
ncbi:MAG: hypothetical protein IKT46_08805 [Clostridia bacterium]|nr:hypothetical protein [Clostridia bacterium]